MKRRKKQKHLPLHEHSDFLSERKRMLNETAEENIIYEESQTGPQEEPTLQEIHLNLDALRRRNNGEQ